MFCRRLLLWQADRPLLGRDFHQPHGQALVGTPLNHALEPTQLFEAAVELANFFILTWMFKSKKFDGQILAPYLFLYGIARLLLWNSSAATKAEARFSAALSAAPS